MKSEARTFAESFSKFCEVGAVAICAPPAPSTVSHPNYTVSYYGDRSILICAKGEEPIVLDDEQVYYRDTVEHLARCLGNTTQADRASMLANSKQLPDSEGKRWIDGVQWNSDGSFAAV